MERHRVAIVRVEIRGRNPHELLIEMLEVSNDAGADRLLTSTTNPREACRMLAAWLDKLAEVR
jgi:hypothetical protein